MSEQPSRHQRSMAGMVGALIVTLLAIVAFVSLRAVSRNDLEVEPEPVDHVEAVGALQEAGREVVYPETLPEGWMVTTIDSSPGERPVWGLGMLTDDGAFVGVRQEDESVSSLVETFIDEAATEGEALDTPGALAASWETWTDDGGDVGYAAELGEQTVLVYGSAGAADVQDLLDRLTTEPLAD